MGPAFGQHCPSAAVDPEILVIGGHHTLSVHRDVHGLGDDDRWLVVVGLLPVPGPFDEAVLVVAAVPLFVFYRPLMRDAWQRAAEL